MPLRIIVSKEEVNFNWFVIKHIWEYKAQAAIIGDL